MPYEPAILPLGIYPIEKNPLSKQRLTQKCSQQYIWDSLKLEMLQMPVKKWMKSYPHSRLVPNSKQERIVDTCKLTVEKHLKITVLEEVKRI